MVRTDFPLSDVPVGNHGSAHLIHVEEVGLSKSINHNWKKLKRKGVTLWKDKNRGSVDFYEDDDMGEKTKKHPFFLTKKSTDI